MFYVYVIQSETGLHYIGQTEDLKKRLSQHNEGKSRYTKRCKHWELIYQEEYSSRKEAIMRETALKTGKGREFLEKVLSKSSGS
jgi:putative endonuclease